MEVGRTNFKELQPLISESIKKADFLAIDTEFTGLINGREVSMFDTPEEYYSRLVSGCSDFMLIQFGLCAFYWDENRKHYLNDAYNFYLFPRRNPAPERMFLCQSSSLDFLAANGFDFNKLIKDGISYMTKPTESKLRETLFERHVNYSKEKEPLIIPDEHKQQIEDICAKVKTFIRDKSRSEMEIDKVNAFIRLLLFQELRTRFKGKICVDTKVLENKSRVMKVTRVTSQTEDDPDAARKQREWRDLEDAVGFSKIAHMISQSEKLIIGHNMLLDLIHTLNHFFEPLTTDYPSFKEFAHCMFPKLLDTKYMSSLPPFKEIVNSSVLQDLLETLIEAPFKLPTVGCREGRGYCKRNSKCHEAGYDAYVTGLCFLGMHSHLQRMRGENSARIDANSAVIKPFLNKIFLARTARQESPYINLNGSDPNPSRDHVFHITFPKEWQRNDINALFSPFGSIIVQFLDESSAYIALERRDRASEVMRSLRRHARISITTYHNYKMSQRVETPRADPYRLTNIGESKGRKGILSSPCGSQKPTIVHRTRSTSATLGVTLPTSPVRKRTSSGVFQVSESEPAPKKLSLSPTDSDGRQEDEENGRDKSKDKNTPKAKSDKNVDSDMNEKRERTKSKIVEKFDVEAKSSCVSAFKESDSWD